ncbi:LOW QUALITY PROTEIN: uncharacterized protein LOC128379724 [Scomber japonicus]|uniref:LOW QUALITY PROTEIN: uncharacterized protein LOC128379724 n=1 Tax=Scomber japonicus TaxID=13676 RepID=UPI0023061271|nr:LOW QUALITY PROTEIN: uncharacterized protein LOC128379724 [Scomber japonicus]
MVIERAHRIGKRDPKGERQRPIVAKFLNFKDRELVWSRRKELKRAAPGVYLNEDFSEAVRQKRKELLPKLREAWDRGDIAYFKFDHLVVHPPRLNKVRRPDSVSLQSVFYFISGQHATVWVTLSEGELLQETMNSLLLAVRKSVRIFGVFVWNSVALRGASFRVRENATSRGWVTVLVFGQTMSQDGDCEVFPSPAIALGQAGLRAENELDTEARDRPLAGKRCTRKRKRSEAEIEQLQLQVEAMQNTLQGLVHAQRPAGLPGMGRPPPDVWDKDPYVLSIAASDSLEGLHDPQFEEDVQSLSDLGDGSSQASEPEPMDPSDRAVITRVAARAQLVCQAPPPAVQCLTGAHGGAGAETHGVATAPRVGATFAMLAGAVARAGREANHPDRRCRATDNQLRRAYHASALAARLACTNSLLLLYLEGLLQDLASAAPSDEMTEMLRVADMLLRVNIAHAQALGQSMASMVWLSQSNLSDQDCIAVLAAPVVPGEIFGPPCEAALEQSRRTRELTRSSAIRPPGRRSLPPRGSQSGDARLASIPFAMTAVGVPDRGQLVAGADGCQPPASRSTPQHLAHWRQCTRCPWVLNTLESGYRLQFRTRPPPFPGIVPTLLSNRADCQSLVTEVSALLKKGAITPVPSGEMHQGFYSTYFLVPKKDGGLRPILNLKGFNGFLKRLPFRMLRLSRLLSAVRHGNWFTTVDLRNAYFHIPIHRGHRKYLRFFFQGTAYEYAVLPFGLSLSPRTFTKCMEAVLAPLRRQGIHILNYLDDWLVCSPSERQAQLDTLTVLNNLKNLGLALNREKSCLVPSKRVEYLGLVLDLTLMRAVLTLKRTAVLMDSLSQLTVGKHILVKCGRRLLGLMAAASQVVPLGLLHMRPLQRWLARHRVCPHEDGLRAILVSAICLPALAWWTTALGLREGVPLGPVCSRVTITTDASKEGWGALWATHPVRGLWGPFWRGAHINLLELEAVYRALVYFLPAIRGKYVLVRTDNSTVVAYVNRQGGLRSGSLHNLAHKLLLWAHAQGVSLKAIYLPGAVNMAADLLSRGGPRPGEWRLHPQIVEAIWSRFGEAQVDLFASRETTHCPLWYSIAGPTGTLGVDALAGQWPQDLLYAFPPFLLIPAALARVGMMEARVLLVAPDWPHQPWMATLQRLLAGTPWCLPVRPNMLSQAQGQLWHQNPGIYRLHVWPVDGNRSAV